MEIPVPEEYKPLVKIFHDREEFKRRGKKLPYILFGFMSEQLTGPKDARVAAKIPALHMLDCSSCSGQRAIIEQYAVQKGYRILEYWFPVGAEPEVKPGQLAVSRLANPESFKALENVIYGIMAVNKAEELEVKNKAMEEELAALKAEKEAKNGKR